MSGDESKDTLGGAIISLARLMPKEVAREIVHGEKLITTYDALRRVVESGNSGKYYFKPSLEEYERCMREGSNFTTLLTRRGFAFHATLPQGLQKVGDDAFHGCSSLTSVTFPEGLQKVGDDAFHGCSSLTSVTFPEGLQEVGYSAFEWCSSLTSVTFLKGLQQVGEDAFSGCWSLQVIYVPENIPLNRNYLGIHPDVRIVRIRLPTDQGTGSANKKQRTELRF